MRRFLSVSHDVSHRAKYGSLFNLDIQVPLLRSFEQSALPHLFLFMQRAILSFLDKCQRARTMCPQSILTVHCPKSCLQQHPSDSSWQVCMTIMQSILSTKFPLMLSSKSFLFLMQMMFSHSQGSVVMTFDQKLHYYIYYIRFLYLTLLL